MMGEARDVLLPVEDAKAEILGGTSMLGAELISVAVSHGRVLAEDLVSRITQPPKPVSAMDGYAVRSADVAHAPATLKMIGESAAGTGFAGSIGPGETVRIFTGAAVPEGGDAIVIQEDTDADGDQITLHEAPTVGRYVRPQGLDFEKGQVLLKSGTTLNSRHVALAAGMNIPWINVTRKPRVAILSTGNELVLPGETVGEDQIISSNSIGMAAFVDAAGGIGINLGIARDDPHSLKSMLQGV
ncbi:MAG: molybdopterin molybdotransferase MoeA, partial [Rhodospirillales bacterium]|nr:molybdopterin molybdotransferase MoeA [Rhodospirillales bacterium]